MREIFMPRLDPEMKEGTILKWFKKEGDRIQKGEPIAEVEGEKVIFNVESPETGILARILVKKGNSVPIGTPIAILAESKEEITKAKEFQVELPMKEEKTLKASPLARKIAKEHSLDLTKIEGSGREGRIMKKDVLGVIQGMIKEDEAVPSLEPLEVIPLVGMQKTIADRMTFSYRTVPHAAITMEVDVSEALRLRQTIEKMRETKIPFTAFLTKVVAHALKQNHTLNATLDRNQIKIFKNINVGVAVAVEDGLLVPVVHNSDKKSLIEIASLVKKLIEKARERKLSMDELKDGTFTITNLGGLGVDVFIPIINPPQTAILGVGKIAKKPRVVDEQIRVLSMMTLTLVFDHRVINGAKASQFLQEIKKLLEDPYKVFVEPL